MRRTHLIFKGLEFRIFILRQREKALPLRAYNIFNVQKKQSALKAPLELKNSFGRMIEITFFQVFSLYITTSLIEVD